MCKYLEKVFLFRKRLKWMCSNKTSFDPRKIMYNPGNRDSTPPPERAKGSFRAVKGEWVLGWAEPGAPRP